MTVSLLVALLLSGAPERHYLKVVDGKQCQLRAAKAIAAEKERVGDAAIEVFVSYDLAPERLPSACIPGKPLPPQKAVCQACGCPQPFYYCVRSTAAPAAMAKLGYAPVRSSALAR